MSAPHRNSIFIPPFDAELKFATGVADNRAGKSWDLKHMQLPSKSHYPCVARHPILAADEKVLGYELLFQQDGSEPYASSDMESVACAIIDTLSLIGLDVLCDGRAAFIDLYAPDVVDGVLRPVAS